MGQLIVHQQEMGNAVGLQHLEQSEFLDFLSHEPHGHELVVLHPFTGMSFITNENEHFSKAYWLLMFLLLQNVFVHFYIWLHALYFVYSGY